MKRSIKKIFAILLSAVGASSLVAGVAGCTKKSVSGEAAPDNIEIIREEPPRDGSLPTAYSCAENLAYINYVFDHQEQYHSYSSGVTLASIATQTTRTFRDFKDGILVTTDLTYSSMIKNSTQTCTVVGEGDAASEVYFRAGSAPVSDSVLPTDIKWNDSEPTYFSEKGYHYTYGLLPNELFNYIINEDTIIDSEEIEENSDGTYTLSFTLDPDDSTYYYKYGMKTRGGLAAFPDFKSIEFTVIFDADWRILTSKLDEVAKVNKGVVVDSVSHFTCDYWYGDDNFDDEHYAYYEDYYKKYVGDESLTAGNGADQDAPLDVTSALANGFASIMNGGDQFAIDVKLGKNTYSGYVWLSLDLADIAGSIQLRLSLGKTLGEQDLYAEYSNDQLSVYYGEDFALSANIAEISLQIDQFKGLVEEIIDKFTAKPVPSATTYGQTEDEPDVLADLLGCMQLEEEETSAVLTLNTDDLLGLGIGINAKLFFDKRGNKIAFLSAKIDGISVGGSDLGVALSLTATTVPVISHEPAEAGCNLADYVADVYSLLSSDLIKVDLQLHGDDDIVKISALKGLTVDLSAYLDLNDVTVGAEANVTYVYEGMPVSATLQVIYDYTAGSGDYGIAYLYLKQLNGKELDLKLSCNVKDLSEAISGLLTTGGAGISFDTEQLTDLLKGALSTNFAPLLSELKADGSQIKISVNVDTILKMLNVRPGVKFGNCTLAYRRGDSELSVSLPSIGFKLSVSGEEGEIEGFDTSNCLSLNYVIDDVFKFIDSDLLKVDLTLDGDAEGVTLQQLNGVSADLSLYVDVKGITVGADVAVSYKYDGGEISAKLLVWYDNQSGKVALYLYEIFGEEVSVKLYCNVDEIMDGISAILTRVGVSTDISIGEGVQLDLENIIGGILTADLSTLLPEVSTAVNGFRLGVNVDEVLSILGVDAGFSLGNVNLAYRHANSPSLYASVPSLGLNVVLRTANGNIVLPDTDEYFDISYLTSDVLDLLDADLYKLTLNINGDGEGVAVSELSGLDATLTAYLSLAGITVGVDADLSYVYNGSEISAKMSLWYENDGKKVALYLYEIMGNPVEFKVFCGIDEISDGVKAILELAGVEISLGGAQPDVSGLLSDVLGADFSQLLNGLTTTANSLKISVDTDRIISLFGLDLGISFGNADLIYQHADSAKLLINVAALGLDVELCGVEGEISLPDTSEYLDLAYVIDDVLDLAKLGLFKVNLSLDGDAEGVTLNELNGVSADVTAYIDINGRAVCADVEVSYALNENSTVSAKLSVWYDIGSGEYGTVYLSLTELNGVQTSINVYCNVNDTLQAVKALLKRAGIELEALAVEEKSETTDLLGDILDKIININFASLIPELTTSSRSVVLAVDVDEVLSLFNLDLGLSFGQARLTYMHAAESCLYLNLPAFGLSVNLAGAESAVAIPDANEYLNLQSLVEVVDGVWEQITEIIDKSRVSFAINKNTTFLALDGIVINFGGNGEVCWAEDNKFVALDLTMAITEVNGATVNDSDEATVKILYNSNATEDMPLIRLSINEVGLDIYQSDIESVKQTFATIYNNVKGLLGAEEDEGALQEAESKPTVDASAITSNDKLMTLLFELLSSDGWVKLLGDFTMTSDGKSVALSYLSDNAANVTIGADNGIILHYDGSFGDSDDRMSEILCGKAFALSGDLSASAVAGSLSESLNTYFDEVNKSTVKNGDMQFLHLAYNFLFEGISCFSVENILGSDTYAVQFTLNGDNTNIDALKGINIDAQIYVTGAKGEQGKLAEGLLNIDAKGVVIELNVITERLAGGTNFYIEINRIMDVVLNLKILATQDSLYDTIKTLVNAVNNTDLLDLVSGLMGSEDKSEGSAVSSDKNSEVVIGDEQVSTIASIIEHIVNFNFSEAFTATSASGNITEDGVLDVTVNLDNIISQLGIEKQGFGTLGSARVTINHNDHSMTTAGETVITDENGKEEVKQWIALSSRLEPAHDYTALSKDDYISIEFLPDLLNDVIKFATDDDGKIYDSFTLSGSINANINLVLTTIKANIDISTLTVSIGEDGLWFSGILHINKISALSIVTIPDSTVGITYANGYITLARGLTSGNVEYKIMTLEYFLDHMLVKDGSVLEWWLNVSGWSTLISVINTAAGDLNISSGLTNPEDIYLYKESSSSEEYEISMYDYVDSLRVIIDGKQTACFGNYSEFEKQLGVTDNYYGFALNGGRISGGVLNKLYAAITRNSASGISGVKAYASIDAGSLKEMVKLSVNLNYEEGLTEADDYSIGTSLATSGVRAPNFYSKAVELAGGEGNIDFAHKLNKPEKGYDELFGCYSTADGSYDYSHMLYTHELTIVGIDGNKTVREVRHGSTVYLYDDYAPIYTDSSKTDRLIYSTDGEDVLTTKVVINGDTTICAVSRPAVNVVIESGASRYEVASFMGGRVPTSVRGLETIGDLYYDSAMTQAVGANDVVSQSTTLKLYGVLVQSEVKINYVTYKFTYDASYASNGYYTVIGRAAGFNDYYCANGNTLVLENEIDGYPVIAIAAEAFANTEGHSINKVVVPQNITYVGEKAFLDNVGMQSITFLANEVTMGGSSGEKEQDNTTPFYGCSAEAGGKTTNLVIYYNTVKFEGSTSSLYWTKFRRDGSGAIYNRYYVGTDPNGTKLVGDYDLAGGGAIYGAGKWQYVQAEYDLDVSGVASTKLNEQLLEQFLSAYYPMCMTSDYIGSPQAMQIELDLQAYLTQFDSTAGGITNKCVLGINYSESGNVITVTYSISFTQAAKMTVISNYDCTYYGVSIYANTPTEISIPVDSINNLATPTHTELVFVGMDVSEQADGSKLCTINWREKYTYTISFKFSGNLVNTITMSLNDGTSSSKSASALSSPTFSFTVKEGQRVTAAGNDGKVMTLYIDGEAAGTFTSKNYGLKSGYSFDKVITANESYNFKF